MTLLVRDEQDVLSANIEYHLSRGVDFVIATDNLSVDATPEILRHYESAGVLEYYRETSDDYEQSTWVTRMARTAYERHGADWVINNDADEFWWPESGDSLKDVLRSVPDECFVVSAERNNFVPRTSPVPGPFFESMVVRECTSLNAVGDRLPPKVCHRGHDRVVVAQGNHHVRLEGAPVPACGAPLSILHFPLRSYEQFENKIVKGGAAYERNQVLPPNVGRTWRLLYDVYREGGLPAVYAQESVNDVEAAELVRSGECVVDTRLRDYLLERVGLERVVGPE